MLCNYTYPARCPVCGDIVVPAGKLVCDKCKSRPKLVLEPRCKKCSKPLDNPEQEYCFDCSQKTFHYEKGYSLWIYDSTMKKSISWFKYGRRKEYAEYYAEELAKRFRVEIKEMHPDVIIPVPIHISKLRQRGFNQAELVATKLGLKLEIPVESNFLIRRQKTAPQKDLSNDERAKNLCHAFAINSQRAEVIKQYKSVLLFDDIYTTGSTIESCAKVLRGTGMQTICFLTICIGRGF